jgi:DNA-binding MarR family transcriptional regulator
VPPGPEPLDRLLVRAGLAVQRFTRSVAAAHGLSATALDVLGALVELDEVSHRDLAGRLRLAPATLTPVLDALEGSGALVRARDGADRRVVRVSITERGREQYAEAATGVANAVAGLPTPSAEQAELIRAHLLELLDAVELTAAFDGCRTAFRSGGGGPRPVDR